MLQMRGKGVQFGAIEQPTHGSLTLSLCSQLVSTARGLVEPLTEQFVS